MTNRAAPTMFLIARRDRSIHGEVFGGCVRIVALLHHSCISTGLPFFAAAEPSRSNDSAGQHRLVASKFTGVYAPLSWALLLCNVVVPWAFWLSSCGVSWSRICRIGTSFAAPRWQSQVCSH
jgi:hypothetical protein